METEIRMPERPSSHRRANKPLVEKRRRARINDSLGQLKSILLQAMKQDSAQFSRLEKADILEMTVKYLRHMQVSSRQQVSSSAGSDPGVVAKYRAGFNECANEVLKYVQTSNGVKDEVRSSLTDHLAKCLSVVNTPSPMYQEKQTTYDSPATYEQTTHARTGNISPVEHKPTRCLQPLQIQIPESADMMTSSPSKQTTPHSLLLMPIAQSTPIVPSMQAADLSMSSSDSSLDSYSSHSVSDFKPLVQPNMYHRLADQHMKPPSPTYPLHPVARMSTGTPMYTSVSPVQRYSPPQYAFQEEKVWRPW